LKPKTCIQILKGLNKHSYIQRNKTMSGMKKIIECVPNFSEGRNSKKIEIIVNSFRGKEGVKLLDYQSDMDHNRMVVTVVGEPVPLKTALIEALGSAIEVIDMTQHKGQHPRMGAIDVVPFIPVKNVSMTEAVDISRKVAKEISEKYNLPVFLYEESAGRPERRNLADIRKGQFEAMADKIKQPEWKPDFGPAKIHPTAGVTAVGARMPLVAFNVNLDTNDLTIANDIAKKVRHISGGLRYCKGIGVALKERGIVQVSMNMTDYTKTALFRSFELIKTEAKRYDVNVVGSEIIGLVPMEALIDTAVYYLGIEKFSMEQVLEARIME
jgi:glutamate formiminotransferase